MMILNSLIIMGCLLFYFVAQGETNTPVSRAMPQAPLTQKDFKLIPHKAEYDVAIEKKANQKDQYDEVKDIKGKVHLQILDAGDGWVCEQQSQIIVYYQDGSGEIFLTTIATWEKKDGSQYRFRIRTSRHGSAVKNTEEEYSGEECVEEPIEIQGEAYIKPGSKGIVYFRQPADMTPVTIPVNTMFPLHYLQNILEAIRKNQTAVPDMKVFDASSEILEPVEINAVISNSFDPKLSLNQDVINTKVAWNVSYALFPIGSADPQPESENTQIVLPAGVVSLRQISWDGIVLTLTLRKLEIYEHTR